MSMQCNLTQQHAFGTHPAASASSVCSTASWEAAARSYISCSGKGRGQHGRQECSVSKQFEGVL